MSMSQIPRWSSTGSIALEDMLLEWEDIEYSIPLTQSHHPSRAGSIVDGSRVAEQGASDKTILHRMSGKAEPNQLLAIMGTSGAGLFS